MLYLDNSVFKILSSEKATKPNYDSHVINRILLSCFKGRLSCTAPCSHHDINMFFMFLLESLRKLYKFGCVCKEAQCVRSSLYRRMKGNATTREMFLLN